VWKLVTVIGHQFITLTVDICVQHGGREVQRCAGLSAAADTRLEHSSISGVGINESCVGSRLSQTSVPQTESTRPSK